MPMYTKQALREIGLEGSGLSDGQRKALDEQGYFLVEGVYSKAECREMAEEFDRLTAVEWDKGGHEVHVEPGAPRVSNIFNKTAAYDRCLGCKPLLAAAAHLLGEFKIHGANLRDPLKGQGHQDLHCDVPKYFPDDWWVANGILLFDDMTLDSGPTRLVPGSHPRPPINIPYVNIGDWKPIPLTPEQQALVPQDFAKPYPGEIYVTAPAGSGAVLKSSVWDAGPTHKNGAKRRGLPF